MKHVIRVISHWGLLLHIYTSMAGFTLVLLFAVSGLTLNHQDFGWGDPKLNMSTVDLPMSLMAKPDKMAIGNQLKGALGIRSQVTDYHEDPDQIQITFAVPGKRTVVTIHRADGKSDVESETRGILGKIDDLHKGFDSGRTWYWIIDIAAVILIVSSLTGMITLLALRARRRSGFIVGSLGVALVFVIYLIWVPR
jgi:hypothetical protein